MNIAAVLLILSMCIGLSSAVTSSAQGLHSSSNRPLKFKRWTAEEDATLLRLVNAAHGHPKWPEIATQMNLITRQVYDRYHSRLEPSLRTILKGKWTAKDDAYIVDFIEKATSKGGIPKWTELGRIMRLPIHIVKTRYNKHLKLPERSTSQGSLTSTESADTHDTFKSALTDNGSYVQDDGMPWFTFQDVPNFDEWMARYDEDYEIYTRANDYDIDQSAMRDDTLVSENDFDDLSNLLSDDT